MSRSAPFPGASRRAPIPGTGSPERGSSLIEVLIAMVLLGFSILAVLAMLPQGYDYIVKAGRISTINHLAYEKLEELKEKGFGHTDLAAGNYPTSAPYDVSGFPSYSRRWYVTDGVPETGMKRLVVEVGHRAYLPNGTPTAADTTGRLLERYITYLSPD